nr:SJCHGC03249 protein [Schistosoma japonicum]
MGLLFACYLGFVFYLICFGFIHVWRSRKTPVAVVTLDMDRSVPVDDDGDSSLPNNGKVCHKTLIFS